MLDWSEPESRAWDQSGHSDLQVIHVIDDAAFNRRTAVPRRNFPRLFQHLPSLVELKVSGPDTRLKELYGPAQPSFMVGG